MTKRTIPRKILVLGMEYKIKRKRGYAEATGNAGLCNAEVKEITLDSDLVPEYMVDVFMHELVHAYQFESGLAEILDRQALEMNAQTLRAFLMATFELKFLRNKK